jgi:hypothetical protein
LPADEYQYYVDKGYSIKELQKEFFGKLILGEPQRSRVPLQPKSIEPTESPESIEPAGPDTNTPRVEQDVPDPTYSPDVPIRQFAPSYDDLLDSIVKSNLLKSEDILNYWRTNGYRLNSFRIELYWALVNPNPRFKFTLSPVIREYTDKMRGIPEEVLTQLALDLYPTIYKNELDRLESQKPRAKAQTNPDMALAKINIQINRLQEAVREHISI